MPLVTTRPPLSALLPQVRLSGFGMLRSHKRNEIPGKGHSHPRTALIPGWRAGGMTIAIGLSVRYMRGACMRLT